MINNVVLVGRLTRELDLKYTSNGTAVASFTIAAERPFKNASGEKETDFINCVIWRKSAENLANFTRKGSMIGVEGSIQTRKYENQQGQTVYVTEVNVKDFRLLESKEVTEQRPRDNSQSNTESYHSNQSSTTSTEQDDDPFLNSGQSIDISDDDLPF
ncbi:single-stranded DNA-binding protein [Jeotgalibaca sp. MA1X17-3]|uniref:single-stranded DNA-binding protein n=1 Tax=Jeotgalibaca sp. MA1X17-3 TaxID=2908211 RepID=UPI001F22B6A6|nr:single-stranded DNA-binding protein [Jeotgalibaca sp. MA1X17-3]UJF15076.1 single-stranded DNA-binding protein [Jeotgalibaca sp. MA1X17-3]